MKKSNAIKKYLPHIAIAIFCIVATWQVKSCIDPKPEPDHKPIIEKIDKTISRKFDSIAKIQESKLNALADQDTTIIRHENIQSRPITDPVYDSLTWAILGKFPDVKRRRP
jgi:hypothetical protein